MTTIRFWGRSSQADARACVASQDIRQSQSFDRLSAVHDLGCERNPQSDCRRLFVRASSRAPFVVEQIRQTTALLFQKPKRYAEHLCEQCERSVVGLLNLVYAR